MAVTLEPLFRLALQEDAGDELARNEQLSNALRAADDAGIERAWIEVDTARGASVEVLHRCAAAASHCERLRLVAGALDATWASWIRLAEDAATVDGLLGGRLELGFDALPSPAWIARIREAWVGAPVAAAPDQESDESEPLRVEIYPRPAQPDGPPLWVLADSPPAARAATECEFGVAVDVQPAEGYGLRASEEIDRGLDRAESLARATSGDIALRVPLRVRAGATASVEALLSELATRS